MGYTNFYEKALFVKTDVAVALCGRVQQSCVLFARAMLLSALSVSLTPSAARCTMRSIFSATQRRCNLRIGLSFRMDQVHMAQSPYVRSEARSGESRGHRPLF